MSALQARIPAVSQSWITKATTIYIICQPLLDILNGISIYAGYFAAAGRIIRPLFMLLAFAYVIFSSNFTEKRWWLLYLGMITAYLILFMVHLFHIGGLQLCIANLHNTARSFYPPIILSLLYVLYRQCGYLVTTRTLALIGAVYATVIVVAIITNSGFLTYSSNGYGFRGWFAATNEVGCIIGLLGSFTICFGLDILGSLHKENWWKGIPAVGTMAAVAISANFFGTKTIFLLIVCYLLLVLIRFAVTPKQSFSRSQNIQAACAGIMLLLILVLYFTSPLRGYLNGVYLKLLQQNSELEQYMRDIELERTNRGTWLWTQIQSSDALRLFDQLLSRRLRYISPSLQVYSDGGAAAKLLGIGYADTPAYGHIIHFALEMDPVSSLLRHGIIGFLLLFVPYIVFTGYAVAQFFRNPLQRLSSLTYCTTLYGVLMSFAISVLAGHILTSTAVSTFVLAVGMQLWDQTQRQNGAFD